MATMRIVGRPYFELLQALPLALSQRCMGVTRDRCIYTIQFKLGDLSTPAWTWHTIEIPESWGLSSARTVAKICLELP